MTRWRIIGIAVLCAILFCVGAAIGLDALDRAYPPPLKELTSVSTEVVGRDGELLRAFATPEGRWRLKVSLDEVDPKLVRMLIAYEDKHFYTHHGVDVPALFRAAAQWIRSGHIVSGGSTLTMQLARLIEPRSERTITAKLRQILRALQIERRLTKKQILEAYLTLAPYGGNLEGVRAASLAWFGKEPKRLSVAQAALLVALPQLPEKRRPDRNHADALAARNRVLQRVAAAGLFDFREVARAEAEPVPATRHELPALAAQTAAEAMRAKPSAHRIELTISRSVQEGLENVARKAAIRTGPKLSVAMVMADAKTGEILGEVGSADFFDAARSGWIDMTRAIRSPGSTLKPFIYGLAFEEGLIAQQTIIADKPADFDGYRPRNFDMGYQGDVSIRQALQMSLNVPAIRILDAVGPFRLLARFRQAGIQAVLPKDEAPGLAIGLGGIGISLRDLVQLYTALANHGEVSPLHDKPLAAGNAQARRLIDPVAAWQVGDILAGVMPPLEAPRIGIAYKTGTSYGYRDAWSVGFDGRHVLGVWIGRPDGGPVPGLAGYVSAAPILFQAFTRSGLPIVPLPQAPAGALRQARADLPITLQRFTAPGELPSVHAMTEPPPRIIFPPNGARVDLEADGDAHQPLVLKLQGGRAPFRWLANGKPLAGLSRKRVTDWTPDGGGSSTLTVIDAAGRAASVTVYIQ
ncbi:MAG: penicillin-binding protein 1C [Rhizobiaceae bacterium]